MSKELFVEWKDGKRKIYESLKPFPSEFEAWLSGYVEGMAKAAEIESSHHEGKGRKSH